DLGGADPGDHTRGADGTGTDPDLDRVRAGVDEQLGTGPGGDVARGRVGLGVGREFGDDVGRSHGVTVCGVHHEEVGPGLHQQPGAFLRLHSHTNGTADNQASVRVLGGVGELLALDEVLDGDQAAQALVGVDEGKFFHFVSAQQFESVIAGDIDRCGDQVLGGHNIADQSRTVAFETHVAVGDDTHEAALPVGDRYTGDPVTGAQAFHFGEGVLGATGDRVGDHACFGTFDEVDLGGLLLGGQVAVEHTRPTLASHRHGHPRLG